MTDGFVLVLDTSSHDVKTLIQSRFKEVGGVWCIEAINNDNDLAIGAIGGLFILQIIDNHNVNGIN